MKQKKGIYYKNLFIYSCLQTVGNAEKYFSEHTEKLVVFVLTPRQQYDKSLLRIYRSGKLVEEKKIILSRNALVYYTLWYLNYLAFVFKYFSRKEKVIVMTWHPISLFGMSIQKMIRNIDFLFWDGDYFPPVHWSLIMFENIKKFYNKRVKYTLYQADAINEKMNGTILNTPFRKTVMWGVIPRNIKRKVDKKHFNILFVGVVRESQGLEFLFNFLKTHKDYSLKLIGVCEYDLYKKYKQIIKDNKIESQVYFPNRFFSDQELEEISKICQVGIAVYDIDPTNATYYTDPGKVKTYASLGLPIIMSDVSGIAPFIKKFKAGKTIHKDDKELGDALLDIRENYKTYLDGLGKFNKFFYYEEYYKKAFKFLENHE